MRHRRWLFGLTLSLGMILALLAFGARNEEPVFAQGGASPTPTTTRALPPNQPERGLFYDGLAYDTACGRGFRVVGTDFCTHGPDTLPSNSYLDAGPSLQALAGAAKLAFGCDGDGFSGKRVQVLYVRPSNRPDRYNEFLAFFLFLLHRTDLEYQHSAAETGGMRRIRFVHDASCIPTIDNVTVSPAGDDSFSNTVNALQALGYTNQQRKYMIFLDNGSTGCGGVASWYNNDSPLASSPHNRGPSYAMVNPGCWTRLSGAAIIGHELNHNLGGVQDSAPHSTARQKGGAHCTDEYDTMCYPDAPGVVMTFNCPSSEHLFRLDCNHEDYFHTNPPAGSYLSNHWNTANSEFLIASLPTCAPTVSVVDLIRNSSLDTVRVVWKLSGQNCDTVTHTNVHWDTLSHSGQDPYKYKRFTNAQTGGLGKYQTDIFVNGEPNLFFKVDAFLANAPQVTTQEFPLACAVKPTKPQLLKPKPDKLVKKATVKLDWAFTPCAEYYQVKVRLGTERGDVVAKDNDLQESIFKVTDLASGEYNWQVQACNLIGCSRSDKWRFEIE